MGEVVNLIPAADPDIVLEEAKDLLSDVVLIGYDKDGELFAAANKNLSNKEILWLIEAFKNRYLFK